MKRLLLLNVFLFFTIIISAQGWGQIQKIVPNDRFIGQFFGADVAIDDNYAVVGVLVSNSARDAYVYENDGSGNWIQIQKLQSPNFYQFDHFGTAVAISGDYIFVGAWGHGYDAQGLNYLNSAGAVYIFKKQESGVFDFEQKIVASDREALNAFGYGIALGDGYAVISPVRHDYDASGNNFLDDAGTAYVFELESTGTWNEVQKIVASDRKAFDYFGQVALAVEGNYIAVGSYGEDEDENGSNTIPSAGSAYIFERATNGIWNEIQKIVASDRTQGAFFGWSIGLDGDTLVVGSNQDNAIAGSVYVFEKDINNIWIENQKLTASNTAAGDRFGQDLGIDGNRIIVGAHFRDIGSPGNDGAAYIFEKTTGTWLEIAFIYDTFNNSSEYFGYSVAISGDYAFVGAYEDDEDESEANSLTSAGAAFIFDANEPTLSTIENSINEALTYYPNPTNGHLTIDLKQNYSRIEVALRNQLGQEITKMNYRNTNRIIFDIDSVSGLYFIEVRTSKGDSKTFKIIRN